MRAGLFVNEDGGWGEGAACRGGFNRIVGEAGCSAWNAHHQIGKNGAIRSYLITRWVGWRFGAVLGQDLRKVCGTLVWLVKITCECVTRIVRLNRLDMQVFGEGQKVCPTSTPGRVAGANTALQVDGRVLEPIKGGSTDYPSYQCTFPLNRALRYSQ